MQPSEPSFTSEESAESTGGLLGQVAAELPVSGELNEVCATTGLRLVERFTHVDADTIRIR